jgi:hypothetical protein
MANFYGTQSINGLQTFALFTAPAAGIYFVDAKLQLPQLVSDGLASAVVALVKNGASTIYTGVAGASGFSIPAFTCALGDVITCVLSSAAACDNVLNAVTGVVAFGNDF